MELLISSREVHGRADAHRFPICSAVASRLAARVIVRKALPRLILIEAHLTVKSMLG
jgi:hypothetical protein